jgi:hypothetical protein
MVLPQINSTEVLRVILSPIPPCSPTTCARAHPGLFDALDAWTGPQHAVQADLGYEGEADRVTCPIKKPNPPKTPGSATRTAHAATLSVEQRTINLLHSATRALAERGNSLLKTTFKALRRVSLCPWRDRRHHRRGTRSPAHRA